MTHSSGTDPVVRPTPRSVAAPGEWSDEHPAGDAHRGTRLPGAASTWAAGAGGSGILLAVALVALSHRRRRGGRPARLGRLGR